MKPFFEDKRHALDAELERWMGTPWRHREHTCQAGCDCIGLVYGVLVATGFMDPATPIPDYPRDWHLHNATERLVEGILAIPGMLRVPTAARADGDVLVFRYGLASAHVGINMGRSIVHAPTNLRVIRSPLGEYAGRLRYAFRPMAMEEAA